MRIFAIACDSANPTWVQDFPPSVLRYTPSPGMMLPRMQASPIPMKTTSGLLSLTATSPTAAVGADVAPPIGGEQCGVEAPLGGEGSGNAEQRGATQDASYTHARYRSFIRGSSVSSGVFQTASFMISTSIGPA